MEDDMKKLNLGEWLQALSILGNLLKMIVEFMKSIEMPGQGAAKLEAALIFIRGLLASGATYVRELTPEVIDAVMEIAKSVIGAIVDVFNFLKIFNKPPK